MVLYDVLGRKVRTLVDEVRAAGEHRVAVDASDLPSGIYVARMQAGDVTTAHKLLLLK
jgi:serine protease AprX